MTTEEIRVQFERKVRAGIFRPVLRHITGNDPEERLAEAVAMTFELYWRKAQAGMLLDDALLVHHCRLRATDLGRQLVRGGQRKRDALDPRNFHQGRVEILRLDGVPDEDGELPGEEQGDLVIGLSEGLVDDPSAQIISAIDLQRWAESLPGVDRAVLAARYRGCTLLETAEAQGASISAVFARLKRLGGELAERAGVSLTKKQTRPRATSMRSMTPCAA